MSEFLALITSDSFMIGVIIVGVAFLLCLMIYFTEKNTSKRRMKHNTRELNKLVEEIKEEIPVQEEIHSDEEPVIIEPDVESNSSILELMDTDIQDYSLEKESVSIEPIILEEGDAEKSVSVESVDLDVVSQSEDELEYTTIEPDQATAKLELEKIAEELKKENSIEDTQNVSLTNYEEQQEENAIISLDELVRKSKKMYEENELTQYADEGNEPITLQELAEKVGMTTDHSYEEPFIIANVVPEGEVSNDVPIEEKVENVVSSKGFQSSPIISPIYGIERGVDSNELALENTANYEKLDQEIKRTNEFLMTLKELQNELKQ